MKLKPLFEFDSDISDVQKLGDTPHGNRIIYVVAGGKLWGERVNGTVQSGGGDWVLINANGLAKLDVRKTLKTDDGALIYITYTGLYQFNEELTKRIDEGEGYDFGETLFQVQMQFETGDPRYDWLNTVLAVAEGRETGQKVHYRAFEMVS